MQVKMLSKTLANQNSSETRKQEDNMEEILEDEKSESESEADVFVEKRKISEKLLQSFGNG